MDDLPPQDFLARAEELADALYADIRALRHAADALPARSRRALVDKTFRHAHTFKGTAATFPQFAAASRLAHELESLLEAVRAGRIAPGEEVLDACEDAAEALSRSVEAAARRAPAPDTTEIIERLRLSARASDRARDEDQREARENFDSAASAPRDQRRAATTHSPDAADQWRGAADRQQGGAAPADVNALPIEIEALLNADEQRRIQQVRAEGARLVLCEVTFDLLDFDEKFRRLTDALNASAEIVSTLPAAHGAIAPSHIGFRFLCAADAPHKLSPLAAQFGARLTELSPDDAHAQTSEGEAARHASSVALSPDEAAPRAPASRGEARLDEAGVIDDASRVEATEEAHSSELSAAASSESSASAEAAPSSSFVRVQLSELDDLIFAANELFDDAWRALDSTRSPASVTQDAAPIARPPAPSDAAARVRQNLVALVERVMALRMQTLARTIERAARAARVVARRSGKRVEFEIEGGDARVDRAVAERLAAPLEHLLRNAVAHGIESPAERRKAKKDARGRVRVEAVTEGSRVRLTVADDGRGVDVARVEAAARAEGLVAGDAPLTEGQALRLIFRPGFSTAAEVSHASGRGVGLDAVEYEIERAGGEVRVRTSAGRGTIFELRLPLALALVPAVLVRAGAHAYAFEASRVVETYTREPAEGRTAGGEGREGRRAIRWRDSLVPLVVLRSLLGQDSQQAETAHAAGAAHDGEASHFLIMRADDERARDLFGDAAARDGVPTRDGQHRARLAAVAVDQLLGRREVLVRTLGRHATRWRGIAGAVDLRDGTVALMLDLARLLEG